MAHQWFISITYVNITFKWFFGFRIKCFICNIIHSVRTLKHQLDLTILSYYIDYKDFHILSFSFLFLFFSLLLVRSQHKCLTAKYMYIFHSSSSSFRFIYIWLVAYTRTHIYTLKQTYTRTHTQIYTDRATNTLSYIVGERDSLN